MSTLSKIKSALRRVKHYYIKKNRYKNVIKNLGDDITNSNYFKNNDINKCFNNKIIDTNNDAIIERIIQAYKKAKKTQKGLPEVFQVSNEWLPIFSSDMGKIMNALDTGDKLLVKNIYENFMRESCSMGLHGLPGDMNNTYFVGKISKLDSDIYLQDTIY
ncbi:MAG: hypothetical protein JWR50_3273, partial [Mucilaginibacter sp.]|nr:hypothetical protein [Mucilaginibacter sp.]